MAGKPAEGALVIVESPTKARTIKPFLPKDFVVKASVGHVRDLPNNAADIPAKYKKESWSRTGVNVDADFEPLYVVPKDKKELVREMKAAVKQAKHIYFATDEDREGESISWHLLALLGPKVPFERLVFHEITRDAIHKALESPRAINDDLVQAQETRRIVDRLFGYEVSPLLWKKMLPRLSAGRVQSVAVRLLVERERARIRFKEASYWGMKARFSKRGEEFEADLVQVQGKRVVTAKDFNPDTGKLKRASKEVQGKRVQLDGDAAKRIEAEVREAEAKVIAVERKPFSTSPQAPYVTSSLQQDANSKLRFQARHTMRLAQQLYENGFITYMRTDSTMLSNEAKGAARELIKERFGEQYLSEKVRFYRSKVKNAQEAHEAIRPAGGKFRAVEEVRKRLGGEAAKLYQMIWRRTVASQMRDARGVTSTVQIASGEAQFRANGRTIEFPGFLKAYGMDIESASDEDAGGGGATGPYALREKALPELKTDDVLLLQAIESSEHRTQPPQRYTEGNLIKELERLGIGRPSTWATIVDLVQSRAYAFRRSGALVPTFTAMAVVGLLEKHFTQLADYQFTAELEDQLDAIARGELGRLDYLKRFYFGDEQAGQFAYQDTRQPGRTNDHAEQSGLRDLVKSGESDIRPQEVCSLPIGATPDGKQVEVRIGRYGPFLSDGDTRCSLPEALAPDELDVDKASEMLLLAGKEPEALGEDPQSGLPIYIKQGRFGPFVQLGDGDAKSDVKRASLLKGMTPETLDLDTAVKLLSLPRVLGRHPKSKEEVIATNGRYGPFVRSGKEIRSLPADKDLFEVGLDEAVALLSQEKPTRRSASRSEPLRVVGKHPSSDAEIKLFSGRYGPYVTDGEVNASLPRGSDPNTVTVDTAVDLLRARAARIAEGGGSPRRSRKRKS